MANLLGGKMQPLYSLPVKYMAAQESLLQFHGHGVTPAQRLEASSPPWVELGSLRHCTRQSLQCKQCQSQPLKGAVWEEEVFN